MHLNRPFYFLQKKIVISVNAVSVDAANISPPKLETILNVSVHVGSVYE